MFFRESCYQSSGNKARDENPTHYRGVVSYFEILDRISYTDANGKYFKFELDRCANLKSYVDLKQNYGQIYWKLTKVPRFVESPVLSYPCVDCKGSRGFRVPSVPGQRAVHQQGNS